MAKKGKIRFIFGRDMSPEEMVDAVVWMAKEYGIPFVDNRKEHGIPIVDSRKKESQKDRGKGKPRISPPKGWGLFFILSFEIAFITSLKIGTFGIIRGKKR